MTSLSYPVTGLTCEHCAHAVRAELGELAGVEAVTVELVSGGESVVTVTSVAQLPVQAVAAALDEAGGFVLTGDPTTPNLPPGPLGPESA